MAHQLCCPGSRPGFRRHLKQLRGKMAQVMSREEEWIYSPRRTVSASDMHQLTAGVTN